MENNSSFKKEQEAIQITEEGGHFKSRIGQPDGYPKRFPVPDGKVDWKEDFPDYKPVPFTDNEVIQNSRETKEGGWADPSVIDFKNTKFNSFEGEVQVDNNSLPRNPKGRTGIEGRGLLGKWGANFAADPIVLKTINGKTYLWSVKRKSGEWAIPGGMVDFGDTVTKTLSKELKEETGMELDYSNADILYEGYVDDPRNTDNAWVETTVACIELPENADVKIGVGKDEKTETKGKEWKELTPEFIKSMYASHGKFVELALASRKN